MLSYLEFIFGGKEVYPELRAIAFIYEQNIARLNCISQHRINVHVSNTLGIKGLENERFWVTPLHLSKGVITVLCKHDCSNYSNLSKSERIKLQANLIHDSLEFLFQQLNKSFNEISHLRDEIINSNLEMEVSLKLKRNKKRVPYTADVIAKPNFYSFDYYLKITNDIEDKYCLLFKGHTMSVFYLKNLFSSISCDKDLVTIKSKNGHVAFKCGLSKFETVLIEYQEEKAKDILNVYSADSPETFKSFMNWGL